MNCLINTIELFRQDSFKIIKMKKIIYSALLFIVATQFYGQKAAVAAADKKYERFSYIDAISTYERVAEKGYKDEKMFQKLANSYYFNAELAPAYKWYTALFEMNQNQEPEYFYRYSQCLKAVGQYDKANKMLDLFNKKSGNDSRAQLYEKNKNYLQEIEANSGRFTIENAGINSEFSDYGSSFFMNQLIFASSRSTPGVSKRVFAWTNQAFTNLYSSAISKEESLSEPKLFSNSVNSKFHESTPVFTKDGKTMYFTRNNYLEGKRGKDTDRITLLKVYKATFDNGKWVNITALPFNSDQYSVSHPALSVDEKTLYFASDMPGTLGQSDLFKVKINGNDTYGTPENLGKSINTEGRETFPYISEDNDLYFATDGRPGLGGLDLYVTSLTKDNEFSEVQNVGKPINSANDDFGFLLNSETRKGYFTSNRPGGQGYDDIYKFTEIKKLKCEQSLTGLITDQETLEILPESKVTLFDENFKLLEQSTSDVKGAYKFEVVCGKTYYVRAEKLEYETREKNITISKNAGESTLSLALERLVKKVTVGTDLAKTLNIPIIYFDLDKSFIRKDAEFELEKVLAVMQEHPTLKIDIRSHTDSRASKSYNEKLSDRRAKSTREWLISKGIAADRLTAKGYGESQLLNKCADGVSCTEKEHQENRRSEFIIVSMN